MVLLKYELVLMVMLKWAWYRCNVKIELVLMMLLKIRMGFAGDGQLSIGITCNVKYGLVSTLLLYY